MKAVVEAYEAYPLTDSNKYNGEINAKRVGYQQGYEKAVKDCKKWLAEHINDYIVKGRDIDLMFDDIKNDLEL